jgi:hypothetical protein
MALNGNMVAKQNKLSPPFFYLPTYPHTILHIDIYATPTSTNENIVNEVIKYNLLIIILFICMP